MMFWKSVSVVSSISFMLLQSVHIPRFMNASFINLFHMGIQGFKSPVLQSCWPVFIPRVNSLAIVNVIILIHFKICLHKIYATLLLCTVTQCTMLSSILSAFVLPSTAKQRYHSVSFLYADIHRFIEKCLLHSSRWQLIRHRKSKKSKTFDYKDIYAYEESEVLVNICCQYILHQCLCRSVSVMLRNEGQVRLQILVAVSMKIIEVAL